MDSCGQVEKAASQLVASDDERQTEPPFFDAFFYRKRKKGKWELVNAPHPEAPVADTHAHLQYLSDQAFALGRCGVNEVQFVCTVVDIWEDGSTTFDKLGTWMHEGAVNVARLMKGRC